jgi:hypothetical protein
VRLVEKLVVEAIKIAQIMRVQVPSLKPRDALGDLPALFAHSPSIPDRQSTRKSPSLAFGPKLERDSRPVIWEQEDPPNRCKASLLPTKIGKTPAMLQIFGFHKSKGFAAGVLNGNSTLRPVRADS